MVFRKLLLMWWSMPIFSFIGYTLTESFRKLDSWRKINRETSSTFYKSNDASLSKMCWEKKILPLRNGCLITFKKMQKQRPEFCKQAVLRNLAIFTGKLVLESFLIRNIAKFFRAPSLKNTSERLLKMFMKTVTMMELRNINIVDKGF